MSRSAASSNANNSLSPRQDAQLAKRLALNASPQNLGRAAEAESPATQHDRLVSRPAFLSRNLQQRMLDGDLPDTLTLRRFLDGSVPLAWADQEAQIAGLGERFPERGFSLFELAAFPVRYWTIPCVDRGIFCAAHPEEATSRHDFADLNLTLSHSDRETRDSREFAETITSKNGADLAPKRRKWREKPRLQHGPNDGTTAGKSRKSRTFPLRV